MWLELYAEMHDAANRKFGVAFSKRAGDVFSRFAHHLQIAYDGILGFAVGDKLLKFKTQGALQLYQ